MTRKSVFIFVAIVALIQSACSTQTEEPAYPSDRKSGPVIYEGGIVGSGDKPDCPQKDSKGKCTEVKP